jgi:hypothetical protein
MFPPSLRKASVAGRTRGLKVTTESGQCAWAGELGGR